MAHLSYAGKKIMLEKECVLGRQRGCGVVVSDDKASRQHARVFVVDGEWWVEDLESANGTKVNGKAIEKRLRIHSGDIIGIGKSEIGLVNEHTQQLTLTEIPDDMIGRRIGGYEIDGLIGKGVTGTIYTATQTALERGVAFKVMDPRLARSDPGFPERFLKTVNQAAALHHDGVVKIHECGREQGLLWYTMELVEGDTLEQLLKRDGAMEPPLALMIVEKAADALAACHAAGLVHGDVKPATIMLTESGHVKVLDIGVIGLTAKEARAVQGEAATKQVFYLAPEQGRGGEANARGDVYSLGCALFHALSGKVPFGGKSYQEVVKAHESQPVPQIAKDLGLPAEVDKVLGQMLSKNAEWRFESMAEVKAELRKLRELVTPDAASEEAEKAARAKIAARARVRTEKRSAEKVQKLATLLVAIIAVAIVVSVVGLPKFHGSADDDVDHVQPPQPTPALIATSGGASTAPIAPTGTTALPPADTWGAAWQQRSAQVDAAAAAGDWGAAELALKRFGDELAAKAPEHPAVARVRLRRTQLETDGEAWYQQQVAALPPLTDAGGRLRALATLRDTALAGDRADAEARYQETLAKLTQRLAAARRDARQAIEGGKLDQLPALAKGIEPIFADTPVAGLHRTFAALTAEAARLKDGWKGDWPSTESTLGKAKGLACLPAAAALFLAGGPDDAAVARKLLADPALANGAALKRREALLGNEAAVLSFDDPGDLQYIETTTEGDYRMTGGALRGDQTVGIACTVPVGGPSWSAALGLNLKPTANDAEAVVSCVSGNEAPLVVRIGPEVIHCRAATPEGLQEVAVDRPADGGHLRLRLACRGGALQVLLDDRPIAAWPKAKVPAGSQLRFEVGGYTWALEDLQVISGQ